MVVIRCASRKLPALVALDVVVDALDVVVCDVLVGHAVVRRWAVD